MIHISLNKLLFFIVITINISAANNTHIDHLLDYSPAIPTALSQVKKSKPNNDSFFQEANSCVRNEELDKAIDLYHKAIQINPHSANIYFNLGIAYLKNGALEQAQESFNKAIELNPKYAQAYAQLGKTLTKKEQYDDAITACTKALKLNPDLYEAQLELAHAYSNQQCYDQAIFHLTELAQSQPDNVAYTFELANTLNIANKTEHALALYKKLLAKYPDNASINYNIAYTLKKLGRIQEAMPYYQVVLKKNPNHTEANFSLGLAYLISGDFERGWELYEWRWKRPQQKNMIRAYQKPLWDGSDLHGKTLFLYAEQGLGDTLQFIRYAQEAKKCGGNIIVAVQDALVPLLSECPYIDSVIALHDNLPNFDMYAPLMSLPYILKTRIDTVPKNIPYLYAKKDLVEQWQQKLAHDHNVKIGICWQGNSNYSTPFLRAVVAAKSIPLNYFTPISKIPNVSIYSLQKQTGTDQLHTISADFNLKTFDGDFDNTHGRFMDTAAVIKNLDLVITIDTSIAHLAAGLGTPTWILVPNPPDWRWLLDRNDTPWYPNMRLFRQPESDDWQSVIEDVVDALTQEQKQRLQKNKLHENNYAHQLERDLNNIEKKLITIGKKLKNMHEYSPLDKSFIKKTRTFYLLSEMRDTVKTKLSLIS